MINHLILSLIIKILDGFVFYFLYQKFREIYFDIRKKEWFLLNVIMTLFWFLAVVFMEVYPLLRLELLELGVYLYAFLGVFIVSIIVIYFFAEMSAYFLHERKSLVMESNYCVLEEQIAMQNEVGVKLGKIRHDIKNLVGDALLLIDKGEVSLARDMLMSLNDEVSDISVTLERSSGNNVIDSIVGYKVAICRQKEIPFTYIMEDLPELDIRPDEMASILSNLLDNAIEASQEAKNPYIKVKIFRYKDFAVLNVENTYKNSPVIRNGKLVTSKSDSDNHGLGMSIVLDMVRKNKGDMNYTFSGDVFKVTILLPKSE
jgi:signal transduction histidine kinase